MKTEKELYTYLKKHIEGLWIRFEPYSGQTGVSDCQLTYLCPKTHRARTIFVELKIFRSYKNPLRATQKAFVVQANKHAAPVCVLYYCPKQKKFYLHRQQILLKYYLDSDKLPQDLFQTPINKELLFKMLKEI